MFLFTIEVVGRANERKARQVDSSSWEDIDWDDIGEKLPLGRNKADRERRKEMFKNFDVNGKITCLIISSYSSKTKLSIVHLSWLLILV